jgi:hypothetical protein
MDATGTPGWPVCAQHQDQAGQSLRRAHLEGSDRPGRARYRGEGRAGLCRLRLSRPRTGNTRRPHLAHLPTIRRELLRRNAVEPVIGHAKSDGLLERNRLAGAEGDATNAILVGAGNNIGCSSIG